jgi:hypothetical protein
VEMVVVVKDQEGVNLMSLSYQVASSVLILGRVSCDGATMAKNKEGEKGESRLNSLMTIINTALENSRVSQSHSTTRNEYRWLTAISQT